MKVVSSMDIGTLIGDGKLKYFLDSQNRKIEIYLEKLPYAIKPSLLGFQENGLLEYVKDSNGNFYRVRGRFCEEESNQ